MPERDRLAADLETAVALTPAPHINTDIADRLIALGWTRSVCRRCQHPMHRTECEPGVCGCDNSVATLDEKRLARAMRATGLAGMWDDSGSGQPWHWVINWDRFAAAIAKAYLEDA